MSDYGGGWVGSQHVLTRHEKNRGRKRDPRIVDCVTHAQAARTRPPVRFKTVKPDVYGWGHPSYGVDPKLVAEVRRKVGSGGTWHVAPRGTGGVHPALVYVLDGKVRGIVGSLKLADELRRAA